MISIIIFSSLFLLELFLRYIEMPNQLPIVKMNEMFETGGFARDRLLFWRFSPNKIYIKPSPPYKGVSRVNSIGFREREISKSKKSGVYRIFCLGGSNTCGEGVSEGERFSNIIEKKLNEDFKSLYFEVYNFGMPGYSTLQMLRLLENELIDFKPDLIIVNPEQADGLSLSKTAPFPDSEIKILSPCLFNLTCFLEEKVFSYRLIKQYILSAFWKFYEKKGRMILRV